MLKKIAFLLFLSATVPVHSYVQDVYFLLQFETDNVTNTRIIASFTNILKEEFEKMHFYQLDGKNPGPENDEPDYLMSGFISHQGDRYVISLKGENITNRKDRWEDWVYTTDLRSLAGFREAANALVARAGLFRKGRVPGRYREKTDYEKLYGRTETANFRRPIDHIEMLNIINGSISFPTGLDVGLPFRFGMDFFEYAYIWVIGNSWFGGGIGGKVFAYRSPTAMSFLPFEAYVPLLVYPDDYEYNRKDLYFRAEAGFFIPQYSYLDLSLRLQFNGVGISVGWLYQPYYSSETFIRNESWTLYGGLTFSFGKYTVKWK